MVAAVDDDDDDHGAAVAAIGENRFQLLIPAMCVAEAAYLIERNLGSHVEAAFLANLVSYQILAPESEDLVRMAELVHQYANFPLGATDASIVALAERLDIRTIITLDRRHFSAIHPRHCEQFEVLPA